MATKLSEPIIIYDDDYAGDYVVTAQKRPQNPGSGLQKVVVGLVVIVAAILFAAIVCRVTRKLLT
jgi:hypothetical protein